MQEGVNNSEEIVIKRSETLENARFSNTSFDTFMCIQILSLRALASGGRS